MKVMSRPKRKDYTTEISNQSVDNIITFCTHNEIDFNSYEGTLVDNYIIYANDCIKLKRVKPRKYMIIRGYYINEWSSGLELIFTDSEKKVFEHEEIFQTIKNEGVIYESQ